MVQVKGQIGFFLIFLISSSDFKWSELDRYDSKVLDGHC